LQRLLLDAPALKQDAQAFDNLGLALGEVGNGALFDFAIFIPVRFTQKNSRRRIAIGNGLNIHGLINIS